MNIKTNFSTDTAKKIFWNKTNALNFLLKLEEIWKIKLPYKDINKGKNKWSKSVIINTEQLRKLIVESRDYGDSKTIIRNMFKNTKKFNSWKDSYNTMHILLQERNKLKLDKISWPFSQWDFDWFVQRVNSEWIDGLQKDEKVKHAAVKYRRIKEINTVRNDFIETLIFEKNNNILPTLNHNRWIDFFIDGESYDQKVAKSPTKKFQNDIWDKRKEHAISNPKKVWEYLYKYQDEGRFWADSRLLVVYIDEDISIEKIAMIIEKTDLINPIELNFDYIHNKWKPTEIRKYYKVKCFVILLYN